MSEANSSGDKTEKPTPKRLRDARRDGNVPKSRDLTQTVTTFAWVLLLLGLSGYYVERLSALIEQVLAAAAEPTIAVLAQVAESGLRTALWLVLMPLFLVAAVGTLVEFLQAGPILAFKKIAPKLSNLHPVQGAKRIWSKDNLIQTLKSLALTIVLGAILVTLTLHHLSDALALPQHPVVRFSELTLRVCVSFGFWVVALFGILSLADLIYQKARHSRRLRMSHHDIRQEYKQTEGDPQLKGQRRQLARQWASQDNLRAAQNASALVVNPTHIAVAIHYAQEECPVPRVTGKAQGPDAQRMREAALEAGVPVMRHVPLARELNFRADYDDVVPEALFDAVAEVLVWAQRTAAEHERDPTTPLFADTP